MFIMIFYFCQAISFDTFYTDIFLGGVGLWAYVYVDFVDLGNFIFRGCEWDNFSFNPTYPEGCHMPFQNIPGVGKHKT